MPFNLHDFRVFCLGPIPAPKHMEIYSGERKENTPYWASWVILQSLHFSNAGALVEICTQSSFSFTCYFLGLYWFKQVPCHGHEQPWKKVNAFSIKETLGLRGEKAMQVIRRRLLQCFLSTFVCIINPSSSWAQRSSRAGSLLSPGVAGSGALAALPRERWPHIAAISATLESRLGCLSLTLKGAKRFSLLSVGGSKCSASTCSAEAPISFGSHL